MSSFDSFLAKYQAAAVKDQKDPKVTTPAVKKNPLMQMHTEQAGVKPVLPPAPPPPSPPKSITEAIQQAETALALKAAEPKPDFRGKLSKLDSLIASDLGLTLTTIDSARGYVKELMLQLRDEPELDAILIDRDVHNILSVIRHIRIDAAAAMAAGKEKSTTRTKKAKSVSKSAKEVIAAFDDMDDAFGDFK